MGYGQLRSTKLCSEGEFEAAIAAADDELVLQPDEPEAHFNRGQALAALDRFGEAVAAYERALGMDASGSMLDPEALDDELFFALRRDAERRALGQDRPGAVARVRHYLALLPAGRHVADVPKWVDKLNGVETVWTRDRA
jgi:tetratricopeptide (TPR) repeat protein